MSITDLKCNRKERTGCLIGRLSVNSIDYTSLPHRYLEEYPEINIEAQQISFLSKKYKFLELLSKISFKNFGYFSCPYEILQHFIASESQTSALAVPY